MEAWRREVRNLSNSVDELSRNATDTPDESYMALLRKADEARRKVGEARNTVDNHRREHGC